MSDRKLPDPPEITPEIARELVEEGAKLRAEFRRRTRSMEMVTGDEALHRRIAALESALRRVAESEHAQYCGWGSPDDSCTCHVAIARAALDPDKPK